MKDMSENTASLKRQYAYAVVIGLAITFFVLVHIQVIHPYPTQYRMITNGSMYKIQEKNWFFPWTYYEEGDCWGNKEVFDTCMLSRAEDKLGRLKAEEKARMIVRKVKIKASPWKPLNE